MYYSTMKTTEMAQTPSDTIHRTVENRLEARWIVVDNKLVCQWSVINE